MLSKQIISISESRLNAYLLCFYQNDKAKQKEAIAVYTALQHRTGIYFSLIQEIEMKSVNCFVTSRLIMTYTNFSIT